MIRFYCEDTVYRLPQKKLTKKWVAALIAEEGYSLGNINYIFISDNGILELNKKYLNHDYYTDVITFDYVENNIISGDIFIGVETVKSNSKKLKNSILSEVRRVIGHGVLHLCGYGDKSEKEKRLMREKEDYYLSLFPGKN